MKQLHRITGIIVSIFIVAHLFNHAMAWFGVEMHQQILESLRKVYRIPLIEIILVASFLFQTYSGIRLFFQFRKREGKNTGEKIQMYSGLILGLFILQHVSATIGQRWYYAIDTNFYFASRVVVQDPWYYYFVPYYFLGIMAFAFHIAQVHRNKTTPLIGARQAKFHYYSILVFFFLLAVLILYVLMGGRYEIVIPDIYNVY